MMDGTHETPGFDPEQPDNFNDVDPDQYAVGDTAGDVYLEPGVVQEETPPVEEAPVPDVAESTRQIRESIIGGFINEHEWKTDQVGANALLDGAASLQRRIIADYHMNLADTDVRYGCVSGADFVWAQAEQAAARDLSVDQALSAVSAVMAALVSRVESESGSAEMPAHIDEVHAALRRDIRREFVEHHMPPYDDAEQIAMVDAGVRGIGNMMRSLEMDPANIDDVHHFMVGVGLGSEWARGMVELGTPIKDGLRFVRGSMAHMLQTHAPTDTPEQ